MNNLVYKGTTTLSAVSAAAAAIGYLTKNNTLLTSMKTLGYPEYFPTLLGVWKLLGAAALSAPGTPTLKEWAYAGLTFTYTGAFVSHLAKGEKKESIAPLLTLALLASSYATRPETRRL